MDKIKENAQEILNLYNYFNGAIIFDGDAVAVYYYTNRPDINDMTQEHVVGKHISEIYPDLNLEKSSIMEALTKGVPTANMLQTWTTLKGQTSTVYHFSVSRFAFILSISGLRFTFLVVVCIIGSSSRIK